MADPLDNEGKQEQAHGAASTLRSQSDQRCCIAQRQSADAIATSLTHCCNPHVPNPAPLGLIAFGLTTALLQVKHTRLGGDDAQDLQGVDVVVMGFAMFFGGLLQLIAGISEIRRNNIFGYTAFCLYGGFWMSIGTIEIVSLLANGGAPYSNPKATQTMLFLVAIFSFMLWVLTFKINKTLCSLFFLLQVTVLLLAIGVFNEGVDRVGGYFGLLTSLNAFWLAFAEMVNDVYGEGHCEVIPVGHWKANQFKASGGWHIPGRIHGAQLHLSSPRPNNGKNNNANDANAADAAADNQNPTYKRQEADIEEGATALSPTTK